MSKRQQRSKLRFDDYDGDFDQDRRKNDGRKRERDQQRALKSGYIERLLERKEHDKRADDELRRLSST